MHNPLRSEAEMFRLTVIIGIGAAVVIAAPAQEQPSSGGDLDREDDRADGRI